MISQKVQNSSRLWSPGDQGLKRLMTDTSFLGNQKAEWKNDTTRKLLYTTIKLNVKSETITGTVITCKLLHIANRYWKITVSSFTEKIPKIQVTPNMGKRMQILRTLALKIYIILPFYKNNMFPFVLKWFELYMSKVIYSSFKRPAVFCLDLYQKVLYYVK